MSYFFLKLKHFNWWNEFVSIPLGLLAFFYFPHFALLLEDNPAVWGVGTFQKFVFAFVLMALANGFGGLFIKLVVGNVFKFKNGYFDFAFNNCTDFQKCVLLLLWFAVYFFGFILSATAL